MHFLISRSSDAFRDVSLPSIDVKPHPRAIWDAAREDWVINVINIEQILDLVGKSGKVRLVVDRGIGSFSDIPGIEIDDITLQRT